MQRFFRNDILTIKDKLQEFCWWFLPRYLLEFFQWFPQIFFPKFIWIFPINSPRNFFRDNSKGAYLKFLQNSHQEIQRATYLRLFRHGLVWNFSQKSSRADFFSYLSSHFYIDSYKNPRCITYSKKSLGNFSSNSSMNSTRVFLYISCRNFYGNSYSISSKDYSCSSFKHFSRAIYMHASKVFYCFLRKILSKDLFF